MTRAVSGAERIEEWLGPAGEAYSLIKPIVGFFAHPLDEVTGDPNQLREKAAAWRAAADQLATQADEELSARRQLLASWEGAAAEAFDEEMRRVNDCLREVSDHFNDTAQLLDTSAEAAQQAQDLVETIVRELIAWLIVTVIVALASAWITAGASLVVATGAGHLEAAAAGTRAAVVGARLARILRQVAAFLERMSVFAKEYKLTSVGKVGVRDWAHARFATQSGYELLATNWTIKQVIVAPIAAPTIDHITGADKTWHLPQVL